MRGSLATLTALVLLGVAACGDDETGGGGDDTPLTPPEQTRSASLNFASGDEAFLVTVWSTPGISEASPSSDITYDLGTAAATQGVRINRVGKRHVAEADGYWKARLAFEGARRAQMLQWAQSRKAGSAPFVKSEAARAAACTQAGCTQQYRFQNGTRTLRFVGIIDSPVRVTVLTDSSTATDSDLMAAADDFARAAKVGLRVMGPSDHTGNLDPDDSNSITVAFTDQFGGSIPADTVGAFIFADFLASGTAQANGNQADILWALTPGINAPRELIIGTLAHEYQHLVSFALRAELGDAVTSQETLWLDEGLSHLMEDLTGWGGSNVDALANALQSWNNASFAGPDDSTPQRGMAYTLLRYLVDQRAKQRGASDARAESVIEAAHDLIAPLYTQSRAGFTHALLQDARKDNRVRDWLRAVYVSGNTDVTQSGGPSFLATGASPQSNGQRIGFSPYGDYRTARDAEVTLAGPDSEDVDDGGESEISDSVKSSGSHYYIVTGGTGTVNLRLTADTNSDINVDALRIR